jgi:hypothetical protein
MLHAPVALIIFNRPATTERVFVEIAKAKPTKLFVIADGPRQERPEDVKQCAAARAIAERVDWDCEVLKNYSDVNLGCGKRPATGITWVFEHVDRAIILEDDCVPNPSFFRFCDELLEKYRDDERIMMVAGRNTVKRSTPYSYCFTYQHQNWGWATWRRAWAHFDMQIKLWPALRETSWLQDILEYSAAVELWRDIFDKAYAAEGQRDYWDYQWTFALWSQYGLAIRPGVNLVKNIGFGEGATHTRSRNDSRAKVASSEIPFPLIHPPHVTRDRETDLAVVAAMVKTISSRGSGASVPRRLLSLLRRTLRKQASRLRPLCGTAKTGAR